MIDFELGDELELVRSTARDFATDHLRPSIREQEAARAPSAGARAGFLEIGFATLEWPESLGGSALGALARCLVLEELAAGDPGASLALDPLGNALYPLVEFGGESALRDFGLPLLDQKGSRAVLAWTGAGSRAHLERTGNSLSGRIPWVPADRVDLLVLLDEQNVLVLEGGIAATPLRGAGLRAAGASQLELSGARVSAEWTDAEAAARSLARARLAVASMLVGLMRESAEYSRAYALDRVAFGRPIAHHQALAFLITDMATAVDSARLLNWEAAWRLDSGVEAAEACATALVEAVEASLFVTPNGVQILGGHGFMQDHPVEKYMREARTLGLMLGGVDVAREEAGHSLVEGFAQAALTLEAP